MQSCQKFCNLARIGLKMDLIVYFTVTAQFLNQHSDLEDNMGTMEQQLKATDITEQVITFSLEECDALWSKVDHDLMIHW